MNIYVASSWRNLFQPEVVERLRAAGYKVYDFKNPRSGDTGLDSGDTGFHWHDVRVSGDDPNSTGSATVPWQEWSPEQFREALTSDLARKGFKSDMDAIEWCDACVLVLPCGKSAHLELGYATGALKHTIIYIPEGIALDPAKREPELMYKMCNSVCLSMEEVLAELTVAAEFG